MNRTADEILAAETGKPQATNWGIRFLDADDRTMAEEPRCRAKQEAVTADTTFGGSEAAHQQPCKPQP